MGFFSKNLEAVALKKRVAELEAKVVDLESKRQYWIDQHAAAGVQCGNMARELQIVNDRLEEEKKIKANELAACRKELQNRIGELKTEVIFYKQSRNKMIEIINSHIPTCRSMVLAFISELVQKLEEEVNQKPV